MTGCLICRAHHAEVRDLRIGPRNPVHRVADDPSALQATGPVAVHTPRAVSHQWRGAITAPIFMAWLVRW